MEAAVETILNQLYFPWFYIMCVITSALLCVCLLEREEVWLEEYYVSSSVSFSVNLNQRGKERGAMLLITVVFRVSERLMGTDWLDRRVSKRRAAKLISYKE